MRTEQFLEGLRPAPNPEGLRHRAMAAARAAYLRQPHPRSWVDRVWDHLPLRWAWMAVVAGLVAGHVAVSRPNAGQVFGGPTAGNGVTLDPGIDVSLLPEIPLEVLLQAERQARPRIMEESLWAQDPS